MIQTNNYGPQHYNKILEEQFNKGWMRPYTENIADYYELQKQIEEVIRATSELGGRKPACLVAAAIRYCSEQRGKPVNQTRISEELGVTEVSIRNNKRYIQKIYSNDFQ